MTPRPVSQPRRWLLPPLLVSCGFVSGLAVGLSADDVRRSVDSFALPGGSSEHQQDEPDQQVESDHHAEHGGDPVPAPTDLAISYPQHVTRVELPGELDPKTRQTLRRAESRGLWTTTLGGLGIVETQSDRREKEPGFQATIKPLRSERIDPILAPGVEGFGHQHDFMGGDALHPGVEPEELVTRSTTSSVQPSVDGFGDKSLYWMPALYLNGERQQPLTGTVYYRNSGDGDVALIPEGLRMIAADPAASGPQPLSRGFFEAHRDPTNKSSDGETHWKSGEPWSAPNGFTVRVDFPEWWDGENLWLPGSSHVSYERTDQHAVRMPHLFLFFRYDVAVRAGDTIVLGDAPGSHAALPGHAFHADFMYGWDPVVLEHLHDELLNGETSAGRLEMMSGG